MLEKVQDLKKMFFYYIVPPIGRLEMLAKDQRQNFFRQTALREYMALNMIEAGEMFPMRNHFLYCDFLYRCLTVPNQNVVGQLKQYKQYLLSGVNPSFDELSQVRHALLVHPFTPDPYLPIVPMQPNLAAIIREFDVQSM